MESVQMNVIARIKSDFSSKFGIPRQSGLVDALRATIIFQPEYRNADALRGLEDYTHLWIIWQFSEAVKEEWSPTVRPPRLGGNTRMGVFATRSPFRPNPIGLSCVKIIGIEKTPLHGTVIHISGADLMDGTPILDIKPYIPYCDCKTDATGGFTDTVERHKLKVMIPDRLKAFFPTEKVDGLIGVLEQDPRPSYQHDPMREYGLSFAGYDIRFRVENETLTVLGISKLQKEI